MSSNKNIILDTCIVQNLLTKELFIEINKELKSIVGKGFDLKISEYTIFESLRNLSIKNKSKYTEFIERIGKFKVSNKVLQLSSRIFDQYRNEESVKCFCNGISDADVIIASTAILTGSVLLTSNGNDFPRPIFKEILCKIIKYKKNKRTKHIPFFILFPNFPYLQKQEII